MPSCLIALEDERLASRSSELLRSWYPHLRITRRTGADLSGGHDVVVVADRYSDGSDAAEMVAERLRTRPDVPVVVVADGPSTERLTELVNAGCTGVWDGSSSSDALGSLRRRVVAALARRGRGHGVLATVRSVRDLVVEWNRLLEAQEVTS
jgi:hypothetical protein